MVVFSTLRKEDCTVRIMYRVRVWACASHVRNDGQLIGGSPEYFLCGTAPCVNGQVNLDHGACGGGNLEETKGCGCDGEVRGGWLYWLDGGC
jgi:hypothetical protein